MVHETDITDIRNSIIKCEVRSKSFNNQHDITYAEEQVNKLFIDLNNGEGINIDERIDELIAIISNCQFYNSDDYINCPLNDNSLYINECLEKVELFRNNILNKV